MDLDNVQYSIEVTKNDLSNYFIFSKKGDINYTCVKSLDVTCFWIFHKNGLPKFDSMSSFYIFELEQKLSLANEKIKKLESFGSYFNSKLRWWNR